MASVQTKLQIGEIGDVHEQEADRVADFALAASESEMSGHRPMPIRRVAPSAQGDAAPLSVDRALNGGGRPMDVELRKDMELRLGHDFSRVRVHTGGAASQSAQELNAQAYTVGSEVVFGAGRFAPQTLEGRRLIAHELAHVVQQTGATGISSGRYGSGHTTSGAGPGLLQMQPTGKKPPEVTTVLSPAESLLKLVNELKAFEDRYKSSLSRVDHDVDEYIKRYDEAYGDVMKLLSAAQKKEMEDEKWKLALEVVVTIGIGMAGGALLEGTELLSVGLRELAEEFVEKHEVSAEIAKKVAEIGILKQLEPEESKVTFGLPADASKDKNARIYLDHMRKAWRGMALTSALFLDFDTFVINAGLAPRPSAAKDSRKTPPSVAKPPAKDPPKSSKLDKMHALVASAESKLQLFLGTVDTPMLKRTKESIERDLWITWISESGANAGVSQNDEEIAEHLRSLGVYEVLSDFSTTGSDYSDLLRVSKLHLQRQRQIGRVGVVAVTPFWSPNRSRPFPGAVHMRPDAYLAAGRQEPPSGEPPYVQIAWQEGSELSVGDVVMLEDTSPDRSATPHIQSDTSRPGGLLPKRLGSFLKVDPSERTAALAFLGRIASEYPAVGSTEVGAQTDFAMSPPRAAPLVFDVREAAAQQHAQPPLAVSESEEGVLVSEADGLKVVLFTVYTSWGKAKEELRRMEVPRVIAVDQNPSNTFPDFGGDGVMVKRKVDYVFEIRDARAALGRGPMMGPVNKPP